MFVIIPDINLKIAFVVCLYNAKIVGLYGTLCFLEVYYAKQKLSIIE